MDKQQLKFTALSLAIETLKHSGNPFTYEDVLLVAQAFENYLYRS